MRYPDFVPEDLVQIAEKYDIELDASVLAGIRERNLNEKMDAASKEQRVVYIALLEVLAGRDMFPSLPMREHVWTAVEKLTDLIRSESQPKVFSTNPNDPYIGSSEQPLWEGGPSL